MVIVDEFSMEDVVCPRSGIVPTDGLKVCFDFLVYPFGFCVQLRVVGNGEGWVVFQEFSKFLSEG